MLSILTSILQQVRADVVLQWLVFLVPGLIGLDILTGAIDAAKHRSFEWRMLADFAGQDLMKYAGILLATLLAMTSGLSFGVAMTGEKTALVLLIVAVLTSVCLHLQDITGLPIAFWQNLLTRDIEQGMGIPVPVAPVVAPSADATPAT